MFSAFCIAYYLDQPMQTYILTMNFYIVSTCTCFEAFASFLGSLIFYMLKL